MIPGNRSFALVVFDLAGTTVLDNRDVHKVLQRAFASHGVSITLEEANPVMGIPKPVAIRILLQQKRSQGFSVQSSDEYIAQIHRDFVSEMISFYETDESVGEQPGVMETFTELKRRGIKVAVDTGFSRAITEPLLKRLKWFENGLIDFSITSDEVSRGRPFPDMIFTAMEQLNVRDPKRVVKIGDTASDVQQGRNAGCGLVAAVSTGAYTEQELLSEKPDLMLKSLTELLNFVI